jgi:hypothetical protein
MGAQLKKQVKFLEEAFPRDTLNLSDFTDAEHEASWYTQKEYARIVKREKMLIKRLRAGKDDVSEGFLATYGLKSHDSRMQRRIRIKEGLLCVLTEQELQWEEGKPDLERMERMARTYHSFTKNAAVSARERALHQERAIQNDLLREHILGKRRAILKKGRIGERNCNENGTQVLLLERTVTLINISIEISLPPTVEIFHG